MSHNWHASSHAFDELKHYVQPEDYAAYEELRYEIPDAVQWVIHTLPHLEEPMASTVNSYLSTLFSVNAEFKKQTRTIW